MKETPRIVMFIVVLLAISSFGYVRAQQDATINDRDIKLVDFDGLTYPTIARTAHIQGVVVVRVKLDDKGRVRAATAISGAEILIPECLTNAKKWRFRSNAQNTAIIVYNFRMTDGITKSGCSHFMLLPPNFATITSCLPEAEP